MTQVADFDIEDFEDRTRSDNKAFVRFFIRPVEDKARSLEEGRPIFKDMEYCEIIVPGNSTNRPIKRVDNMIKRRYSAQYQAWLAAGRNDDFVEGTPLSEVPWLKRSQVEELYYQRIKTLEQLAAIDDNVCTRIPGLYELRRRAQHIIEAAAKKAPIADLQAQLDHEKAQNDVLRESLALLSDRLEKLEAGSSVIEQPKKKKAAKKKVARKR
jgi:hypothetical protein